MGQPIALLDAPAAANSDEWLMHGDVGSTITAENIALDRSRFDVTAVGIEPAAAPSLMPPAAR